MGLITQADLAVLADRLQRRIVRWFKRRGLLDAQGTIDMRRWENSGVAVN